MLITGLFLWLFIIIILSEIGQNTYVTVTTVLFNFLILYTSNV